MFSVLANQRRRRLLAYLHDRDGDVASLVELTDYLAGGEADSVDDIDTDGVAISLHHTDPPKLAGVGLIEYDTRSHTVRYRGHEEVERIADRSEILRSPDSSQKNSP